MLNVDDFEALVELESQSDNESELYDPITKKMRQYELNSKAMSYPHCFGTALRRTR